MQQAIDRCSKDQMIIWGEEHNDSVGHHLEQTLLKALYQKHPQRQVLSMEMFETDVQEVLNEYLQGLIRQDIFETDARVWPNYQTDYAPLIDFAKSNKIPVIAANTPKRYVSAVTKNGLQILDSFPKAAMSYLPTLPINVDNGQYREKFNTIMGMGHSDMASHIFESQNLWDATMAWSIFNYFRHHPDHYIFQINGGFHSENKLGIYTQLNRYANQFGKKLKIKTITCLANPDLTQIDWTILQDKADIIIVTQSNQ